MGTDQALAQAFAAGPTSRAGASSLLGLRCTGSIRGAGLCSRHSGQPTKRIGHDSLRHFARAGMLAAWADNLTDAVAAGRVSATLFRDEAIEQVAACTLSLAGSFATHPGPPAAQAKPISCMASRGLLGSPRNEVLSVNAGSIMSGTLFESEREALLASLLGAARDSGAVLAAGTGRVGVDRRAPQPGSIARRIGPWRPVDRHFHYGS